MLSYTFLFRELIIQPDLTNKLLDSIFADKEELSVYINLIKSNSIQDNNIKYTDNNIDNKL